MPTPDEITRTAEGVARYLTSPETLTPRQLSGAWDGCTMAAGRQGPDEPLMPMLGIYDATVSLPGWAGTFDEHVEALLVFALEILAPGPSLRIDDVQLLAEQVNDDARPPYDHDLLRSTITYWRSLTVAEGEMSEHDLHKAAGCWGFADLLPQHQKARRLYAAWLLIPQGQLADQVHAAYIAALEEGR